MIEKLKYCSYKCKKLKLLDESPFLKGYCKSPLLCKKYNMIVSDGLLCLDHDKGLQKILKAKELKQKRKEGNPHSLASASYFQNNHRPRIRTL